MMNHLVILEHQNLSIWWMQNAAKFWFESKFWKTANPPQQCPSRNHPLETETFQFCWKVKRSDCLSQRQGLTFNGFNKKAKLGIFICHGHPFKVGQRCQSHPYFDKSPALLSNGKWLEMSHEYQVVHHFFHEVDEKMLQYFRLTVCHFLWTGCTQGSIWRVKECCTWPQSGWFGLAVQGVLSTIPSLPCAFADFFGTNLLVNAGPQTALQQHQWNYEHCLPCPFLFWFSLSCDSGMQFPGTRMHGLIRASIANCAKKTMKMTRPFVFFFSVGDVIREVFATSSAGRSFSSWAEICSSRTSTSTRDSSLQDAFCLICKWAACHISYIDLKW